MAKIATLIRLRAGEQRTLEGWRRAHKSERRAAERARIILLAAQGMSNLEIAAQLGTRPARVSKWRTRFARQRLAGLADKARPGKPGRYDAGTEKRMLRSIDAEVFSEQPLLEVFWAVRMLRPVFRQGCSVDLRYSDSDEKFRAELRAWLAEAVKAHGAAPPADDWNARREYDTGWQKRLFEGGYAGINWPTEYGGRDLSLPPKPIPRVCVCRATGLRI